MLWSAREGEARERVMKNGCTEITLSDAEKKKFRDAMEPLYEKYCGNYMDLVDQIRQTGAPDPQ
jgi:TRAP-type C4-dicarboxylate transport system substrate-binding protein